MITPKKQTATGSARGDDDPYMHLIKDYRLNDAETNWMKRAKCKNRNDITWFPEPGEGHLVSIAKKFCKDCVVRKRCLVWALDNEIPYGVWGGMSASDRKKLLPNNVQHGILEL